MFGVYVKDLRGWLGVKQQFSIYLFNVGVCFIVYIRSEIEATLNKGYQFLALGRLAALAGMLFIDNAMRAC